MENGLYTVVEFSDNDKWFVIAEKVIDGNKYSYLIRVNQAEADFIDEYRVVRSYFKDSLEYMDTVYGDELKRALLVLVPEAKDFMEDVALKLQELGCDTLMWTDTGKGIFVPGTNTIDALIEITKRVEAAIFIFNADDKTWNKNSSLEGASTVRDNVLFEYGLFTGALGKKKVCFVCKDHPEVATDLKGITYIDGNQKSLIIKNKLKDWINAM